MGDGTAGIVIGAALASDGTLIDQGAGPAVIGLVHPDGQVPLGRGAVSQLAGSVTTPGKHGSVVAHIVGMVVAVGQGQHMIVAHIQLHNTLQAALGSVEINIVSSVAKVLLGVAVLGALLRPPQLRLGGIGKIGDLNIVGEVLLQQGVVAQLTIGIVAPHPHRAVGAQGHAVASGGGGAGGGDLDDIGQILLISHATAHADQSGQLDAVIHVTAGVDQRAVIIAGARGTVVLIISALAVAAVAPGQHGAVLQQG